MPGALQPSHGLKKGDHGLEVYTLTVMVYTLRWRYP